MFERYTEKARRVIFFARCEASQFGAQQVETEHLLLAFVREDPSLSRRLLPNTSLEALHKEVESRTTVRETVSTSVDMPVSNESKRVLAYAAEEAERLGHKHIGSEHLLLGLLRETRSLAANLLTSHGVRLEDARTCVANLFPDDERTAKGLRNLVQIHNQMWDRDSLQPQIRALSRFAWRKQQWKPMDILVEKDTGRAFFDLSLKDDPKFELQPAAWQQGQCEICGWELNTITGPEHSTGYTNGRDWVCEECYTNFLSAISRTSPSEPD
ncbi:MAG TPA: Clp protease N-terminal domain-containing protein [Terriglobales bacterium]|nr:Clp protease N-terminal domain-containing protein [Terriglobales bacterium]